MDKKKIAKQSGTVVKWASIVTAVASIVHRLTSE